jgi:S1-C subfamily serine protease
VRRIGAAALAALGLVAGGCDSSDGGGGASAPDKVTTTRVQVVHGIGREGGFDPGQIYERLSPGVVTVISIFAGGALQADSGEGGQGSGFVLDGQGYIATNAHVVTTGASPGERSEPAEQVFVEFSDGNRVPAEIVGDDPNADVALLKLERGGLSLTPLELGASDSIDVGDPVAAIGSPFGERQSLSIGVVSAVDRTIESLTRFQIGNAIQTDAAINPGNSGGPLLDAHGRVIGINAQIKSESGGGEGVGFAVPVDAVRRSLSELRTRGRVSYGYLGVSSLVLWPQAAERLGLSVRDGAVVQRVEPGSPAEKAGLRAGEDEIDFQATSIPTGGDVIIAVDGRRLTRTDDLADVISAKRAGQRVELDVLRDGERRTIEVQLGQRPEDSG